MKPIGGAYTMGKKEDKFVNDEIEDEQLEGEVDNADVRIGLFYPRFYSS